MMIDIDHFKLYNDRYGHVSGDTCLRSVGETLSLVTLENAVLVARYGGEEFALLLPGLDLPRIASLAEAAGPPLYAARRRGRNRVAANAPTRVSTPAPEPLASCERAPPLVA